MSFIPELRDYLKEHKVIYTVRKYKMSPAIVEIEGVGQCKRLPLGIISCKDDLGDYYKESGFPTVEAWWAKIIYFIPRAEDIKYLYRIEVLSE
jgi:hypothetical protein